MNQIAVAVDKADYNKACADLVAAVEKYAEDNPPKIYFENSGIGGYEFWGAKGFDHGTNTGEIEDDRAVMFTVDCTGMPEDIREDFATPFDGEYYGSYNEEFEPRDKRTNTVEMNCRFVVSDCKYENNTFSFVGKWVERD